MDSYVLCVRNKDAASDQFGSQVGSASYLAIPEGDDVPTPSKHPNLGAGNWLDAIVKQAIPEKTPAGDELDIVFFVHGYNTDPKEALIRQRVVEQKLVDRGFNCMVIGFDWPTAGNVALYEYDRFTAQKAASKLMSAGIIPFAKYSLKNCPINIHCMAHSMGAFVVREAFRSMDKGRDANLANDWRIGQMVLFAGDISSDCFVSGNADMASVFDHCGRLTNYFSGCDEALAVSNIKNIDMSSRVGRVGMPPGDSSSSKAIDVDCTQRYLAVPKRDLKPVTGMLSHSWYLGDEVWYDDLAITLAGQIDRNAFPTRDKIGTNDFVLHTKK